VTFPLIKEALSDGYVPLQVFVPVMENISAGTGTQPVFLKLSWSTLKKTTSSDSAFDDKTTENDTSDDDTTTSSLLNFQSTLKSSTLGTTSLKSTSLGSGVSALKSGASALKSSAMELKSSVLEDGAALLSSTLDDGAFDTMISSAVDSGNDAYMTGTITTETETAQANGRGPVIPVATSVLVLLAGIFFKLKSRGLLMIR